MKNKTSTTKKRKQHSRVKTRAQHNEGPGYLEGNGCLGAVEAYGDDGVPGLRVLLGATGAGPRLSLVVGAILALLALLVLLAHDGWHKGPCPGDPALIHLVVRPSGLHVEL